MSAQLIGSLVTVEFDAIVEERHTASASVTRHPVEDAVQVVDHVQLEPDSLELHGIVSCYPIGRRLQEARAAGRATDVPVTRYDDAPETPINEGSFVDGADVDAWNALDMMRRLRSPVQVATSLRLYRNMIIASISAPRDIATTSTLDVRVTLEEIRFVELEEAEIDPAILEAMKPVDQGKQEPRPADEATADRAERVDQSVGNAIYSAVRSIP